MRPKRTYGGLTVKEFSQKQRQDFLIHFGRALPGYWNAFLGFDIVKFDKHLNVPDYVSLSDFLLEEYSQEAHDLVEILMRL